MFFDRLDSPAQGPQLVGGAVGVYQARNRGLRPDLQRWMQQDPNGTGQVVLNVAAMHGGTLFPSAALPSAGAMFTDGLHLAAYLGSSPVLRADALGLSSERGARAHGLAPGWYGPGWYDGGVFKYEGGAKGRAGDAGARMRALKARVGRALGGAGTAAAQELGIALMKGTGACLAHILYGQDGPGARDVLNATLGRIEDRAFGGMVVSASFGAAGSQSRWAMGGEALYHAWRGDYSSSLRSAALSTFTYLRQNSPSRTVRSAAWGFAGIAIVAGGIYSGMLEYSVNDAYNWGFGVQGAGLSNLWEGWD